MKEILLEVQALKKHFPAGGEFLSRREGVIPAVDGVGFQIERGETLGLVGESGCGKSTLARMILRLETPTSGEIRFKGEEILSWRGAKLKAFRREVQLIFQDPYSSLNPRQTAGAIIGEPLKIHGVPGGREEIQNRVRELAGVVGLNEEQLTRYPHEFSGGQRQRIGIARALILRPALVVADEPVSALDVSIRAQILNLLKQLQRGFGLTYLFIAHDLAVVRHMSDRIAVMYLGKIVEVGSAERICTAPVHPYTLALLAAVPSMDPQRRSERGSLDRETCLPAGNGCAFYPRCPVRTALCGQQEPTLRPDLTGHWSACHQIDKKNLHFAKIDVTQGHPPKE